MIVADTELVLGLFLPSASTAEAERILRADADWHAPVGWRSEFRSVLAQQVRANLLPTAVALRILRQAEGFLQEREYTVASERVLELAARSGCSAYACEFVALAEALGVPLVTRDREVLGAFSWIAVAPDRFGG